MTTLSAFMTNDHRACDGQLANVEGLVQSGSWPAAKEGWAAFEAAIRCHFAREEELLFPAFEEATGNTSGPTAVMRMEHDQMRALFPQLSEAIDAEDKDRFLGLSDTLMVLTQQHNMKEEQILYPMGEQVIPEADELLTRIVAREPDEA